MPDIYLINGNRLDSEEALSFPLFSPGIPIKKAFFESIRCENGSIPFWNDHLERIKNGFKYFESKVFYDPDRIYEDILKLSGISRIKYSKVKVVFDLSNNACIIGIKELSHGLKDEMQIPLFVSIHDEAYGSEYNIKIKKGSYEFQKRALAEQSKKFDERLIKNENNKLIEGFFSNLFWINNNTVFCVIEDTCILEGLMQIRIRKLCEILGIKIVQTEGLPLKEYQQAEAIFLTNMVRGLRCVKKLNGQNYKTHPIISIIQENIITGLED